MSYSQYDEEKYILEAARTFPIGRFLDIGAWHPTQFSNTRALYELGWSGVMVEPSPGPMLNLLEAYGNDERITLIQAAIGIEPGFVELHITDDAVTTSSAAEYEKWKNHTKFRGKMLTPSITLEQISNQFGGVDFVNIDAEGISVDLFHRMLALGWAPHCVCVEGDNRDREVIAAATPKHYNVVYGNGTNLVLVRK